MKFFSAAAILFGFAAAETVTITNFVYVAVNGYPQLSFHTSAGVNCAVDHYTVPGLGYPCDQPDWTFDVLEEQGHQLRLHHTVDGKTLSGNFTIRMNGPIPTVLDQVGTSTSDLE